MYNGEETVVGYRSFITCSELEIWDGMGLVGKVDAAAMAVASSNSSRRAIYTHTSQGPYLS